MDIKLIGNKRLFIDIDNAWHSYISKEHIDRCHTQLKVLEIDCNYINLSLKAGYNIYLKGGIIWTPIFKTVLTQLQII